MKKRASGILLHITSLPSSYGIGDFGPGAYRFVDFLAQAKQSFWQILPLNSIDAGQNYSPYQITSVFAYNTLLLSPELLMQDGLLDNSELGVPNFPKRQVDYNAVVAYKKRLYELAYEHFKRKGASALYERFCFENVTWLDDFALFIALKGYFQGRVWSDWPREIRDRTHEALRHFREQLYDEIEKEKFLQYTSANQWSLLKQYAHQKNIQIIGDMPIYVTYDSVDAWSNPSIFKLDEGKRPIFVAGVPPDYFSQTGQLWGNPVYDWSVLKETRYAWWKRRIAHNLKLFDIVRLDHFRGFVAYWEVPAGDKTAVNGKWVPAPAEDFFNTLRENFGLLPIIAEDLGTIDSEVKAIINRFGFPGMKLLLFAFGDDLSGNPYLPHNYDPNCVVYSGTHDNNTVKGWWKREASKEDKKRLFTYLGHRVGVDKIHWEFIRLAMNSRAHLTIFPMQDILGLGTEARMNRPGTLRDNWQWRILRKQLTPLVRRRLQDATEASGRV